MATKPCPGAIRGDDAFWGVEFLPTDDPAARIFASDIIGYLFGYADMTNTRSLALVGDPDANAYELLFSFSSSEEKKQFLELVRSNPEMGNDYIENDLLSPTTEEIKDACPSRWSYLRIFLTMPG